MALNPAGKPVSFLKRITPAPNRGRDVLPRLALAGLTLVVLLINTADYYQKYAATSAARKKLPYIFPGEKFSGLGAVLKGQSAVGYYTDKNLDEKINAMQFAQAQYVLAPVVLDTDYRGHEFILFDCSSTLTALKAAEALGTRPVKISPFGTILARNLHPAGTPPKGTAP